MSSTSLPNEKEVAVSSLPSSHGGDNVSASNVDVAWQFLDKHRDAAASVDIKALRRKIDWHIVPLMFLCYTMQFLDKVILNVSSPYWIA